jgi:phage terminase large subunit
MWFAQKVGFESRVIDYYANSQKPLSHYLDLLQKKKYVYDTLWLPHDARAKQLGTGKSVEEIARAAGHRVRIVPRLSLEDGINAARMVFPNCYFDEQACAEGIKALQNYRYEVIPDTGTWSRKPVHDWASHGADGFRYLAVALKDGGNKGGPMLAFAKEAKRRLPRFLTEASANGQGWMR